MPDERYAGGWACDVCDRFFSLHLPFFHFFIAFISVFTVICRSFARTLSFTAKFASLTCVANAR
jgi:hypothetical protein